MIFRKIFILLLISQISCVQRSKEGKVLNTPTSGNVRIAIDASLKPLLEAELAAFEATYPNADIQETYTSEVDAIKAFLCDSVEMIVITRKLVNAELDSVKKGNVNALAYLAAYDGVALIVNRANADSSISINQLKDIVSGKISNWNQINPSSSSSPISLIFDQPNSGIVRFLRDTLGSFSDLPSYSFGVRSDSAVVEYIAKNKYAIGLIDASWLSDSDDPVTNTFRHAIRVVRISSGSGFYKPLQGYIAEGTYPLMRRIFMISREPRPGLASGFITYVCSSKGQRVVLKAGLVPATMPPREIKVNNEPFDVKR
jgi:ABC-type phosphate transport system substrate-binding protein